MTLSLSSYSFPNYFSFSDTSILNDDLSKPVGTLECEFIVCRFHALFSLFKHEYSNCIMVNDTKKAEE